jgi:UDP-glucose 4-epimerase
MKILVTGSSGRLGSAIADALISEDEVIGLDRVPGPRTTILCDVADRAAVARAMDEVDAVIHTASLHAPHVGKVPEERFRKTNVTGTRNLLESAVKHRVRRFVYSSTTSVYGHAMESRDRAVWVTEDLQPQPRDIYDTTKLAAEELCRRASDRHEMTCLSLRVSRFFAQDPRLVAIYRLYRGVDLRDAVAAHLLALRADISGYDVFNVSAQSPFCDDELAELRSNAPAAIMRHYPSAQTQFAARGWDLPQSIDRVYVVAKAQRLLGYRPRFNFPEHLSA